MHASGRVCLYFSLHAYGRSEDDWAFASPTPRWYHVALSCTPILPLSTCGVTSQLLQPVGVDHRVTRDEKNLGRKG